MTSKSSHVTQLHDCFFRMKFVQDADDILGSARAPEGRFHYGDQLALYLSATPEGCVVATRAYMSPGDPPRAIYPLLVQSDAIVDLRDPVATRHFGIDTTHRAENWQSARANGDPAPTWQISDRVRALGFHGMFYASRTDPRKTHLTLFRWNCDDGALVSANGEPIPWLDQG